MFIKLESLNVMHGNKKQTELYTQSAWYCNRPKFCSEGKFQLTAYCLHYVTSCFIVSVSFLKN